MSRSDTGVIQYKVAHCGAAAALEVAIESAYADLRWRSQLYVWKAGLARTRDQVTLLGDDILHESLERVLNKPGAYDPTRPVHAWVMGFVANVILERQRAKRNDAAHVVDEPEVPGGDGDLLLSRLETVQDVATQRHHQLQEILGLVGPADRQVLELRYLHGLPFRELGTALGITENAARVRHHRALDRLKDACFAAERAGSEDR
ncbi:MAG: sigma-70 family RNA polymerase sigma factor [Chloroflexota bacterium]|nr:sigma-70 family RNA polymerase sigma factor [Chloroflexota bacterium]